MNDALLLLAQVEEEDIGTGPIGLLLVLIMLIVTALLIRNMNGRLKRLPKRFPDQRDDPDDREPTPPVR